MQAPFSPDTVFRQSNRISSGSTIRKDGSLHRKSGSHRWQSAVADRYSQPARRYSCFGRVVQLDRADGTNSPLFTAVAEIVHKCGFATNSTFNRNFKQIMGVTPIKWKQRPENYEQRLLDFNIHTEEGW